MRSLDWLRYICKHRLWCITYNAIHLGFPEYIAQSIEYIIIQSSNRCIDSYKYPGMVLVQR